MGYLIRKGEGLDPKKAEETSSLQLFYSGIKFYFTL